MNKLQEQASKILYDGDLEAAAELKAAGWTVEKPADWSPLYAWRWRRPAKIEGRRGRLFSSTGAAHRALRKARRATRAACRYHSASTDQSTLLVGPRVPARWGSFETQVCAKCGAWRTSAHPGKWDLERDVHVTARLEREEE